MEDETIKKTYDLKKDFIPDALMGLCLFGGFWFGAANSLITVPLCTFAVYFMLVRKK